MIQMILIALLVAGATGLGGFVYGNSVGHDRALANQKELEDVAEMAADRAALKDAEVISRITVTNKTIYQKATHEIIKEPVYVDCRHTDSMFQLVNDALAGRTISGRSGKLPGPDGAAGPAVRNDKPEDDRRGGPVLRLPGGSRDSAAKP